ncbi:hypothetical protein RHSIM_Rhsim04G0029700 [Rhododendron simsii]|uniref:WW domain-containing protein n=1 Tax=Rhododendron simsii TaxID=118357 RepID=A0A834H4K8_RHOSS|nr:hypothetical protein RHSIM_Rhsim04G0029700 [Rhododendron simsii]
MLSWGGGKQRETAGGTPCPPPQRRQLFLRMTAVDEMLSRPPTCGGRHPALDDGYSYVIMCFEFFVETVEGHSFELPSVFIYIDSHADGPKQTRKWWTLKLMKKGTKELFTSLGSFIHTGKKNFLDKPWDMMTSDENTADVCGIPLLYPFEIVLVVLIPILVQRIDASTNWRELADIENRRFFYNKLTGDRSWSLPLELVVAWNRAHFASQSSPFSTQHVPFMPFVAHSNCQQFLTNYSLHGKHEQLLGYEIPQVSEIFDGIAMFANAAVNPTEITVSRVKYVLVIDLMPGMKKDMKDLKDLLGWVIEANSAYTYNPMAQLPFWPPTDVHGFGEHVTKLIHEMDLETLRYVKDKFLIIYNLQLIQNFV